MIVSNTLKTSIPSGWAIKNIREISNITWGQCPEGKNILPLSAQGKDLLDYCSGAGDMKGGFLVDCQAKTNDSRRYAHNNDILVSVAGKIGDMCVVDHKISLGRAAMAFTAINEYEVPFIYMTLKSLNKKMLTISSGSIQKVINNDNINDFNFAYNHDVVKEFSSISTPIFTKLVKLSTENRELTKLRDWLIPMLMNGQAKVLD
ncbi:MAG: restriction endonuclease subunit S [Longibaculum sp.]